MQGVAEGGKVATGGAVAAGRWDSVPAELKRQPRWVCWRLVEKNGRRTKMPVCAATGKMASSTDGSTWCSFDAAVASVARVGGSGVGFVFGPDKAYTGLDLDHVIRGGVLDPAYQWVVDAAGTYTEVSPSGDGLHLYFRGSKPEGADRCRKGGVEMYDHDRFFTVTGVPYTGTREVACRPEVVERAYRAWIEPETETRQATLADAVAVRGNDSGSGDEGVDAMTDDELIDRMVRSRNGAEVRALLDGDMGAYGNDHSAADIALCNKLAFWCAGDEARMDRIFRNSGLMRDKRDSRRGGITYGAQTRTVQPGKHTDRLREGQHLSGVDGCAFRKARFGARGVNAGGDPRGGGECSPWRGWLPLFHTGGFGVLLRKVFFGEGVERCVDAAHKLPEAGQKIGQIRH